MPEKPGLQKQYHSLGSSIDSKHSPFPLQLIAQAETAST
jgi:hypothetical protein